MKADKGNERTFYCIPFVQKIIIENTHQVNTVNAEKFCENNVQVQSRFEPSTPRNQAIGPSAHSVICISSDVGIYRHLKVELC